MNHFIIDAGKGRLYIYIGKIFLPKIETKPFVQSKPHKREKEANKKSSFLYDRVLLAEKYNCLILPQ